MNDLHDLLVRHADAVVDEQRDLRLDQVRSRVRTARRQRQSLRAGLATLVVLVVALGAAVLPRLRPPDPTPADLVGHRVPATTTSLGYLYRYADSAVGDRGVLTLDLEASDKPRVVRWASETAEGTLSLDSSGDGDPWVTKAGGFGAFVQVPAGEKAELTLNQRGASKPGRVAVAVYTLARSAPGVTGGGVTFRESMGSADLVDARIGLPGETSVDLSLAGVTGRVRVYAFCKGPDDLGFTVTGLGVQGSCHSTVPYDTGADTSQVVTAERVGGMRLQVRDPQGSVISSRKGVRIGLAVYTPTGAGQVIEHDGHVWVRTHEARSDKGASYFTSRVGGTGSPARYLVQYVLPPASGDNQVTFTGADSSVGFAGPGGGSGLREVQAPSRIKVRYAQKPTGRIVIRTYQLAR